MITKELFVKFINKYQLYRKAFDRIDEALFGRRHYSNLYESDWNDAVGFMLDIFLESHFTEEGCDLINWWLFEDVDHIIHISKDDLFGKEETKIDVNNIENLYDYLIKNGYSKT